MDFHRTSSTKDAGGWIWGQLRSSSIQTQHQMCAHHQIPKRHAHRSDTAGCANTRGFIQLHARARLSHGRRRSGVAQVRTLVDELSAGRRAEMGMTVRSTRLAAPLKHLKHTDHYAALVFTFCSTVLQIHIIASVVYRRGVGHIPAMRGYTLGLLMWGRSPRGLVHCLRVQPRRLDRSRTWWH